MTATTPIFDPLAESLDSSSLSRCRFCGCSEDSPCFIAVAEDPDGKVRLARNLEETIADFPCQWYVVGVCNAPACLEKLIAESRVLLFDSEGRKIA